MAKSGCSIKDDEIQYSDNRSQQYDHIRSLRANIRWRKRKTEEVEDKVFAELDKGGYHTNRQVAEMLGEKFGIKASVNLAARLVKRWKKARENGSGKKFQMHDGKLS